MGGWERLRKTFITGVGWIVGYGGFWMLKWIIATPVLGYNVVEEAVNQIFYRTSEVDEFAKHLLYAYKRADVLYINWRHYEYGILEVEK